MFVEGMHVTSPNEGLSPHWTKLGTKLHYAVMMIKHDFNTLVFQANQDPREPKGSPQMEIPCKDFCRQMASTGCEELVNIQTRYFVKSPPYPGVQFILTHPLLSLRLWLQVHKTMYFSVFISTLDRCLYTSSQRTQLSIAQIYILNWIFVHIAIMSTMFLPSISWISQSQTMHGRLS